jgi:hypothetical protein
MSDYLPYKIKTSCAGSLANLVGLADLVMMVVPGAGRPDLDRGRSGFTVVEFQGQPDSLAFP